jgi:hypothetical protein
MSTFPSQCLPLQSSLLLDGTDPNVWLTSADGGSKFYIAGGMMPFPNIPGQDGVICTEWPTGLDAKFRHLDQAGAEQDGVTWTGTVYDPTVITLPLEAHAYTPQGLSAVVAEWKAALDPKNPCTLEYWTQDRGYWFTNPRLGQAWMPKQNPGGMSPRRARKQDLTTQLRVDDVFWKSIASTSTFAPGGTGGPGFLPFCNIGSEDGWPGYLVYAGSGTNTPTFSFANGLDSTSMISFGPLEPNQIVLLTTFPRLRQVIDMTQVHAAQTLSAGQKFLEQLLDLVTNNNVPPLLQQFESLFGINPPQGSLYSLLDGRWDDNSPVPGVPLVEQAQVKHIAVKITNGNADSRIIGSITPQRRWPE